MSRRIDHHRIILASKSPRRRYLLEQAGIAFSVIPSRFDEDAVPLCGPDPYVKKLARGKAAEVSARYPRQWIIGADTIVMIDGTMLGKPAGIQEARAMLQRLSGNTHQVFTGFAIGCMAEGDFYVDAVKTDVRFKALTDEEIEWYVHTSEPFDKAGAYAIQGLGTFLVKSIHGSYTNVVGLPVCEVVEFLIKAGVVGFEPEKPQQRSRSTLGAD